MPYPVAACRGRRRPATPTFDPLSLAPVLALRADVGTYQDAALTTPAVLDGDPVGGWHDRSGSGWDVTQATAGQRPVLKLNYFNGHPALLFTSASTQYLTSAAFNALASKNKATLFVVGTTSVYATLFWSGSGLQVDIQAETADYIWALSTGNAYAKLIPETTDQMRTLTGRFDGTQTGSAARMKVWLSGILQTPSYPANAIAAALSATAGLDIGRAHSGVQYLNGPLLEILLYQAALTDAQVAQVHGYIASKWFSGLTSALLGNGDSLTAGYPLTVPPGVAYPTRVAQYLGAGWSVPGLSPATLNFAEVAAATARIAQLAANVDHWRQYYRPQDWHLLWGGANDLATSVAPATAFANLQSNAQARKATGMKVAVLTVTGDTAAGTPGTYEADRQTLNTSIRTAVAPPWDIVIGIGESHMGLDMANNVAPWSNMDGIHGSQAGYDEIARIVAAAITAFNLGVPSNPVQAPAAGATLPHGVPFTVKWESYGIPCITAVNIDYSTDGGTTWATVVTGQTNNLWSYPWTPPNTPTAQGVVRVSDANNAGTFGLSGTFSIT